MTTRLDFLWVASVALTGSAYYNINFLFLNSSHIKWEGKNQVTKSYNYIMDEKYNLDELLKCEMDGGDRMWNCKL